MVLATEGDDRALQVTVITALERIGCNVFHASASPQSTDFLQHPTIAKAMQQANLVVDLTGRISESTTIKEYLKSLRILVLNCGDIYNLNRLVVSSGVARRAQTLTKIVEASEKFEIQSAAGSVLSVGLSSVKCDAETGIAAQTGQIGKWPSGVFTIATDGSQINGELLLMPGDICVEAQRIILTPVHLEIEEGNLVEILGDSTDSNLIRTQLEAEANSDHPYLVQEVSIGLNLIRSNLEESPFDYSRLGLGRGQHGAGWCSVKIGKSMTLTLTNVTAAFDGQVVCELGDLSGSIQPDPYEKSAAGVQPT